MGGAALLFKPGDVRVLDVRGEGGGDVGRGEKGEATGRAAEVVDGIGA